MPTPELKPALDGSRFVVEVLSELEQRTIQTRWRAVNTLLRLSVLTGVQMQLDATLGLLCDYAHEIVPYEAALVYFWSESEDGFRLRLARNLEGAASRLTTANVFTLWAARYAQPLLVRSDIDPAADAFLADARAQSCLVVPLYVNSRVMGALQIFSVERERFTPEDAQLMWILALVSENLLTRESRNEGLLRFAFTDYLTGLRSRGYFEQQLELEIKRAERKGTTFALLMLDIDHFKCFNDTFGHSTGDQVLRDVSNILLRDMREVDTVARYGGEEFVIILPETSPRGAIQVAERLRRAVEQAVFYAGDPPMRQPLTISVGIALYGPDGHHRSELIEAADSALYQAKSEGRNRIVVHSEETPLHPNA
jgi:diguanylate cyclase (GGDEF)-like protein